MSHNMHFKLPSKQEDTFLHVTCFTLYSSFGSYLNSVSASNWLGHLVDKFINPNDRHTHAHLKILLNEKHELNLKKTLKSKTDRQTN